MAFAWDALSDVALKGYDIGYAPQGTSDWSLFSLLTEAAAGTEMTNAEVPPGSWTFGIRARDIADQLSPSISTLDLVVTNPLPVISAADAAPAWTSATYHDLGNFIDIPVVTVSCGGFAGDPVAMVIDLGSFS